MKNNYLKRVLLIIGVIISSISQSQTQQNPVSTVAPAESCGFDVMHQQRMMDDPVYYQDTIDFNNAMLNSVSQKVGNTALSVPVVHITDESPWADTTSCAETVIVANSENAVFFISIWFKV